MSKKSLPPKSSLNFESAPLPIKETKNDENLGILDKQNSKVVSFRIRIKTFNTFNDLVENINKKSNIDISKRQIIELLILDAIKNPDKLAKIMKFRNKS